MDTAQTYFLCVAGTLCCLGLAWVSLYGLEGRWSEGRRNVPSPGGRMLALLSLLLSGVCVSLLFYEYPNFQEDSVVVEYADNGGLVEHPWGTFCYEGDPRFVTVPDSTDSIPVFCMIKDSVQKVYIVGYVVLADRAKFLADRPRFESFGASKNSAYMIAHNAICQIVDTPLSQFGQLSDSGDESLQERFRAFLDDRINPIVSQRGLRFKTLRFNR